MSDDTPTLRLPENALPTPPMGRPPRPSRAPLVAFIVVAVLVVVASGFLVYILVSRGGVSPSAATTTTPPSTPSTTSTTQPPAPPPVSPGEFTSFAAPPTQRCNSHGKGHQSTDVQVSWSTANATQVWIAAGAADAVGPGAEQVPLTGNQDSFPTPLPLDCNARSSTFTLTLVGDDGGHESKTWTVIVDHRG